MKPEVSEKLYIRELFEKSKIKINKDSVETIKVDRLTGDASTRRYYRLFLADGSTYVACLDNRSAEENSFVLTQRLLESCHVRVPKIYDLDMSKGFILEEDLGDKTLLQCLSQLESTDEEFQIYKKVLDQLLIIHNLDSKQLKEEACSKLSFDFTKLMFEVDFTIEHFIQAYLSVEDERVVSVIRKEFSSICKDLAEKEMNLTHRDFHSRNIMVKDDELVIIDFQDARMGVPQYDLTSLLDDCYYDLIDENKETLLKYYFDARKGSLSEDYEAFRDTYDLMTLQRAFKAIGSFAYIHVSRKDDRYLKYIGFAMEKIRKIMLKSDRYKLLKETLFTTYYES